MVVPAPLPFARVILSLRPEESVAAAKCVDQHRRHDRPSCGTQGVGLTVTRGRQATDLSRDKLENQ
eukprot:2889436-Rhodomonas_salina.1